MDQAILMLILALVFVAIEFCLPTLFFAVAAAVTIFCSWAAAFNVLSGVSFLVFVFASLLTLYFFIQIILKIFLKQGHKNTVLLQKDQEGFVSNTFDHELISKQAIAQTDLKPSGYISINSKRYSAISNCNYLPRGTVVKIVGGEGNYLIVQPLVQEENK